MRKVVRGARYTVLVLFAGALAFGCSGRQFAEVEGTVTLDGKPLEEVEVVFVPDSLKGNPGNNASAYTDAQGHYKLRSERDQRDGTVLGPHRVIVIDLPAQPDLRPGGALQPGEAAQKPMPSKPKSRRFPVAYEDTQLTPFKEAEVKFGKQTLDFEIKSARR
jgi:hypothetical protein